MFMSTVLHLLYCSTPSSPPPPFIHPAGCSPPYLLLVVFDGQFELGQVVALSEVQLLALVVVSVIQDGLQLSRTSGLIQQVFGEALALLGEFLILLTELILHLRDEDDQSGRCRKETIC